MSLPRRYEAILARELQDTEALRITRQAFDGGRVGCLVLSGNPGVGKSIAAAWACQRTPGAIWVKAATLTARGLFAGFDDVERAPMLAIDDFGTEFFDAKGVAHSIFDRVIDARDVLVLPTIITTNLDVVSLKERLGPRILDRIAHFGGVHICGGESLRTCYSDAPEEHERAVERARLEKIAEEQEAERVRLEGVNAWQRRLRDGWIPDDSRPFFEKHLGREWLEDFDAMGADEAREVGMFRPQPGDSIAAKIYRSLVDGLTTRIKQIDEGTRTE